MQVMKNNRYFDGNFVIQVTINMCWPSMQSRKMTMISDFIFFYLQLPSSIYDKNLSFYNIYYIWHYNTDITISIVCLFFINLVKAFVL